MATHKRMCGVAMAFAALFAAPAWAQQDPAGRPRMEHGSRPESHSGVHGTDQAGTPAPQPATGGADQAGTSMQGGSAPPDARDPNAYSDGYTATTGRYALGAAERLRLADENNFGALLVDRLERVHTGEGDFTAYDALAWYGGAYDKVVIKAEGDAAQGKLQDARTEVLWGHAVAPFWDTQLGLRYDSGVGADRKWLAMGVQGLAPYWFLLDAAAYVGENGRSALRLSAEYELLFTQRLILQPRFEAGAYGKSDPARRIGSGLSSATAGLRLRYEFTRQFAPYVGVEWAALYGQTADMARAAGQGRSETRWIAGVRAWF